MSLQQHINVQFKTSFPHSTISFTHGALNSTTLFVRIALQQSEDWTNGIMHNDPMIHLFSISNENGVLVAERVNGSISIKPEAGSHMAMSHVKTNFRKTSGNDEKIIKMFGTFFARLRNQVNELGDTIYGFEKINPKYLK